MITYQDLYELLRKEKYNETLQQLPLDFITQISNFLRDQKNNSEEKETFLLESVTRSKKQFENFISLFKELMLRRKKKLLNLVFVATETGIMKKDYEYMLSLEREMFDRLIKIFEQGDKGLNDELFGKITGEDKHKLIIFNQEIEQFVDMAGKAIGPFHSGEVAHIDGEVASILVSGGKAQYVDEN